MRNKVGLKTDPWGTPIEIFLLVLITPLRKHIESCLINSPWKDFELHLLYHCVKCFGQIYKAPCDHFYLLFIKTSIYKVHNCCCSIWTFTKSILTFRKETGIVQEAFKMLIKDLFKYLVYKYFAKLTQVYNY